MPPKKESINVKVDDESAGMSQKDGITSYSEIKEIEQRMVNRMEALFASMLEKIQPQKVNLKVSPPSSPNKVNSYRDGREEDARYKSFLVPKVRQFKLG